MRANPYVITENFNTAVFPWDQLLERKRSGACGVADKILGLCSSKVFAFDTYYADWPEALRPPQVPSRALLPMKQTVAVERSRANILGHGRHDSLTVTFTDRVKRRPYWHEDVLSVWAEQAEEEGWPFDQDAIYAATDYTEIWTEVSKIRLVPERSNWENRSGRHYIELVLQGEHGEETVRIGRGFLLSDVPGFTSKQMFGRSLSERLRLRRATVNFVDEYAV